VVVAYNRRALLMECLRALHGQSRRLDAIVVVDNASEDGSAEAVSSEFPDVDVVQLSVNTGGAGGFTIGIDRAVNTHEAEWVWVMDDDTIPHSSALAALLAARAAARETPAILASRVIWTDGLDHPMNMPRRKPFAPATELRDAAAIGAFPVRSTSFVSMLVEAAAVETDGLPVAEYFIWNDDFEFSARILRQRRGLLVPDSVVVHKTKSRSDTDVDPGERFYYEVRNKLWLFRSSDALGWYERPIYAAATARRWLRTWLRSSDRPTISRTFRAGWHDGMRTNPRSNDAYLTALGIRHSVGTSTEQSDR
jgi:GT2 family glycosyltransferase